MKSKTFNAIAWGSVLAACIATVFASRIVGIIAILIWIAVIVIRHTVYQKAK